MGDEEKKDEWYWAPMGDEEKKIGTGTSIMGDEEKSGTGTPMGDEEKPEDVKSLTRDQGEHHRLPKR